MKDYFYKIISDQKHSFPARLIGVLLKLLSAVYWVIVQVPAVLYQKDILKRTKLSRPVISVGNITWGGAGKTPFVQFLVRYFLKKGLRPVILTRGYGLKNSENYSSDEAELLKESLNVPVYVGADRLQSAQKALQENAVDLFILDDGFQQWKIRKDMDIVLIDAMNPFGNGYVLPGGILREPLSALRRAQAFVLTKTDLAGNRKGLIVELREVHPDAMIVESVHRPVGLKHLGRNDLPMEDLKILSGKKILAVCGIGAPESFTKILLGFNAKIKDSITFPDHHEYSADDARLIYARAEAGQVDCIVTTEKDTVKLKSFLPTFKGKIPVFSLMIEIEIIQGQDELFSRISGVL